MNLKFVLSGKTIHSYDVKNVFQNNVPKKGQKITIDNVDYLISDFSALENVVIYKLNIIT